MVNPKSAPLIIAHRGHSNIAPENTLSAFRQAVQGGADFLELDVHLTKDLVPVVIHDLELNGTTDHVGESKVSDFTLAELKALDAGSWFSSEFKGETVPSLLEVLNMPLGKTGIMIEIKDGSNDCETLAKRVVETIIESNFKGQLIVGSFSIEILKHVRQLAPWLSINAIIEFEKDFTPHLVNQPETISISYDIATLENIRTFQAKDRKVWVWTVDDFNQKKELFEKQVDGIITNTPNDLT